MTLPRQAAVLGLAGYSLMLAGLLLSPSSGPGSTGVDLVSGLLSDLGLPAGVHDEDRVEFGLNVVIFAPWAALAMVVWPRTRWQEWTAYGFAVTAAVELFQGVVLGDSRSATFSDVVANTAGALVGSVAVRLVRGLGRGRPPAD